MIVLKNSNDLLIGEETPFEVTVSAVNGNGFSGQPQSRQIYTKEGSKHEEYFFEIKNYGSNCVLFFPVPPAPGP